MKTGMTGACFSIAASSARLSSKRRSRRNHNRVGVVFETVFNVEAKLQDKRFAGTARAGQLCSVLDQKLFTK